jgi:hypothetical protein
MALDRDVVDPQIRGVLLHPPADERRSQFRDALKQLESIHGPTLNTSSV